MILKLCPTCNGNLAVHLSICYFNPTERVQEIQCAPAELNYLLNLQDSMLKANIHPVKTKKRLCRVRTREKPIFTQGDYTLVRETMEKLPEIERQILYLKFWDDQTLECIAYQLGVRLSLVKSCLIAALEKIKKTCLENPNFKLERCLPQALAA